MLMKNGAEGVRKDFQQKWGEDAQKQCQRAMAEWLAIDLRAPELVMGFSFRAFMNKLTQGRVNVPHSSSISRELDKIKVEHDEKLKGVMAKLASAPH